MLHIVIRMIFGGAARKTRALFTILAMLVALHMSFVVPSVSGAISVFEYGS